MTLVQKLSPGMVCWHPRGGKPSLFVKSSISQCRFPQGREITNMTQEGACKRQARLFYDGGVVSKFATPKSCAFSSFCHESCLKKWGPAAHPLSFETLGLKTLRPQLQKPVLLGSLRRNHLPLFPLPPFLGGRPNSAPNPRVYSTSFLIQCNFFVAFLAIAASYMPGVAPSFKLC